jgi:hypothetical protein
MEHQTTAPTEHPTERSALVPTAPLTMFSSKADLKEQVDKYVYNQVDWSKSDCYGVQCDLYYGYEKLLT